MATFTSLHATAGSIELLKSLISDLKNAVSCVATMSSRQKLPTLWSTIPLKLLLYKTNSSRYGADLATDGVTGLLPIPGGSRNQTAIQCGRTAAAAVLETPELLESILVELDASSVLNRAAGVSKLWRSMVLTSPPIKRRVLVRTSSSPTALGMPAFRTMPGQYPFVEQRLRLNPAIECMAMWADEPSASPWAFAVHSAKWSLKQGDHRLAVLTRASTHDFETRIVGDTWKECLLSDPPISMAHVSARVDVSHGNVLSQNVASSDFVVRDLDGVTLGVLEDQVLKALEDEHFAFRRLDKYRMTVTATASFWMPVEGAE